MRTISRTIGVTTHISEGMKKIEIEGKTIYRTVEEHRFTFILHPALHQEDGDKWTVSCGVSGAKVTSKPTRKEALQVLDKLLENKTCREIKRYVKTSYDRREMVLEMIERDEAFKEAKIDLCKYLSLKGKLDLKKMAEDLCLPFTEQKNPPLAIRKHLIQKNHKDLAEMLARWCSVCLD